MTYVYLLRPESSSQPYVGLTDHLRKRFRDHNYGKSVHTKKFRPWRLAAYFAFEERKRAVAFEKYLKSGSGRAFLKRHVLEPEQAGDS